MNNLEMVFTRKSSNSCDMSQLFQEMHTEQLGAPILVLILVVYVHAEFSGDFGLRESLLTRFSRIAVTVVTAVFSLERIPNVV